MNAITLPVTFDTATRRKDKSVRCAFTSNLELSTAEFAELDALVQTSGWLLYKDSLPELEDIPTEDAPSKEGKPKIQRLRGAYYILWRDKTDQSEPFNIYWERNFESLMDKVKEKID